MRAVCFDNYGAADVLYVADVPTPRVTGTAVRVRVVVIGVNPGDVKWRQGMFKSSAPLNLPHVLGYDIAGIVDDVGGEVKGIGVGDQVFAKVEKGGYAEHAALPAAEAVLLAGGLDFATAAALPTAGLTGIQMIEAHIRPSRGQTVLVTGAVGAVGRCAMFAALRLGARVVAAVRSSQLDEARDLGATDVLVLGEENWSGAPFDHVADTVGGPAVAKLCRHLSPGGLIRTAATTPIDPQGLTTEPVFIVVYNDPITLAALGKAAARGELSIPIARRLPLSAAAEAHRLIEAGGVGGKIVLEP